MGILQFGLKRAVDVGQLLLQKQPIVRLNQSVEEVANSLNIQHQYEVLTVIGDVLKEEYQVFNTEVLIQELQLYKSTSYYDELVLREIFKWLLENKTRPGLFHVNIHPDTLNYSDIVTLVNRLERAFKETGIPESSICFELTEDTLLQEQIEVGEIISAVRSLGCKVALDDFGKSMLNLRILDVLRPDYVKIDGQYVQGSLLHPFDETAVKSIVSLSKSVGAETIAEKIETVEQFRKMRDLGVDYGQGWFFSKALDLREVVDDKLFTINEVK
jgi:EAL domain-containing protein (putative c-di-GMP-specific phosphodiesterase class I)